MAAAWAAVGLGDDLICFALACDSAGDGAGGTSGDTLSKPPMLGNGATGFVSCMTGRPVVGKDDDGTVAETDVGGVSSTGGSKSMAMGAGGATGFDSAAGAGGGILLARNSLRSRSNTALARTFERRQNIFGE